LPDTVSYSDSPWLVHGFNKDELALLDTKTWEGIISELTQHYEPELLVEACDIITVMSYIPKSVENRLLQENSDDKNYR
jgi:hypothetical protein